MRPANCAARPARLDSASIRRSGQARHAAEAQSQARSHEKVWEVQLDMRRQFDAQGMKPGMKVTLILTR
jgi:hypothetical protein